MNKKKYPQPKDPIRFIIFGNTFIWLLFLILFMTRIVSATTLVWLILSDLFLFSWSILKTFGKRFSGNADLVWFPVSIREIPDEPEHKNNESEIQNMKNHV